MAEIVKARDASTADGPTVAVKRILPHLVDDEQFVTMFLDESRVLSALQHEHIIRTLDVGLAEGTPYLALDFVDGKDARMLFMRMRKSGYRLPLPVACYIMARVCDGLHHAHEHTGPDGQPLGLVHRDVSLQNLLLSYAGDVKVTDFGIALSAENLAHTQTGIVKGKFGYMSPEQIRGKTVDRRTDIFSAGICLYELLTVERLFTGDTEYDALVRVRNVDIVPAREINPAIPEDLDAILMTSLAKEPDERFRTAADMAAALDDFVARSDCAVGADDLATCMQEAFSDRWSTEDTPAEKGQKGMVSPALASALALFTDLKPATEMGARFPLAKRGAVPLSPVTSPAGVFSASAPHRVGRSRSTTDEVAAALDAWVAPLPESASETLTFNANEYFAEEVDEVVTEKHEVNDLAFAHGGAVGPTASVAPPTPPKAPFHRELPSAPPAAGSLSELAASSGRDRLHSLAFRPTWGRALVALLMVGCGAAAGFYMWMQARRAAIHMVTDPVHARVELNGQPVAGSSPFLLRDLAGDETYRLEVKKDGYETWSSSPHVAPGETLTIPVVRLVPHAGREAVPAGVDPQVESSANAASKDSKDTPGVAASVTTRGVTTRGSRGGAAEPADVAEAQEAAAELAPDQGLLHLLSAEVGQVYVDGELVGKTPNLKIPLSVGRHRIRWESDDGGSRRIFGVRAVAGRTLIRNLTPSSAEPSP